jgi:phosphoribosylformimino-5-aminoimidazole carboxamide ribotide isomerase
MVQVIPAIDLLDGKVVRLRQGSFEQTTFYPVAFADLVRDYRERGAKRIHVVDLEGARAGKPVQLEMLRKLPLKDRACLDWSGGIRTIESAQKLAQLGVEGLMLGSVCAENPDLASEIQHRLNIPIRWAVDVRLNEVATRGWLTHSCLPWQALLAEAHSRKVSEVMISSIAHDGMNEGPNLSLYRDAKSLYPSLQIVASGGVRNQFDLTQLETCGVKGAIVGRALLEQGGGLL